MGNRTKEAIKSISLIKGNLEELSLGELMQGMISTYISYDSIMKQYIGPSYIMADSKESKKIYDAVMEPLVNEINRREKLYKKLKKK